MITPTAGLPGWLNSRHVLPAGLAVALLVLGVAAGFVAYEHREIRANALDRNRLFARVLEEQANRTFNSVELTLGAAAGALAALPPAQDMGAVSAQLQLALQSQPFLRSLSLLGADGRVLASSASNNLGTRVPLASLAGPAASGTAGRAGLGPLLPARDLASVGQPQAGGAWLLPMLRPLPDGRWLVAVVSPGWFANQYPLLLGDEPLRAALLSDQGMLVAASVALPLGLGQRVQQHPVFTQWLPARERGELQATGLDGQAALLAFRSLRRQPLVVLVETPQAALDHDEQEVLLGVGAATTAVLLVVAALAGLAWRSLRSHESAQGALANARGTLAAQDAFTDRLFQVSPVPTVVKDANGRFMRVNQAWCDFTGLPPERVVGHSLGKLYPPQLAAPHEVQEQMAMATGAPTRYEEQVLDADGLPRDVMIRIVPFTDQGGEVAGVIVCLTDVTEFREAEIRTTEAREAAERANAAKTEFLANISHELRTPLQTILGFSALGSTRSTDQPRLKGMFDDVQQAGQRMLALVNNLLDLSRIDSSVGDVQLQRQDIAPALAEVPHELRALAAERQLVLDYPGNSPPLWAHADATRLQQVLRNLLANAIRFAPPGSTITLDWYKDPVAGDLRIGVADQGPGVPEAELESIFEAFVQSSRTKDGSGGTGLGLAICRKIMAAHHGTVSARNRAEGGAVFEMRLPSAKPPRPDAPAAG